MSPEQFGKVYPSLIEWIRTTIRAHSNLKISVSAVGFPRLGKYFSAELLGSATFVPVHRLPIPPLSALGLNQFKEFEEGSYNAITYLDTYFVTPARVREERLHFHELIHVIQWRLLGPEQFIRLYADGLEKFGYRESPLEKMAYDAEDEFSKSNVSFDAEKRVKVLLQG